MVESMQPNCDKATQIINEGGECETCPKCEKPTELGDKCFRDKEYYKCINDDICQDKNQIIVNDICTKCPICEEPNFDKNECEKVSDYKGCIETACNWETQIVVDG